MGDRFACARDIRRQVSGFSKSEGGDHDYQRTHPRIAGRVERQRSPVCAKTDPNSPKVSSPEPLVSLTITLPKPTRQVYAENAA